MAGLGTHTSIEEHDMEVNHCNCFARETFSGDELSHSWNLIQLESCAQAQHETIVRAEKSSAPAYHRLGRALEIIRRKRGRGDWGIQGEAGDVATAHAAQVDRNHAQILRGARC
jgi:hypothetical protein